MSNEQLSRRFTDRENNKFIANKANRGKVAQPSSLYLQGVSTKPEIKLNQMFERILNNETPQILGKKIRPSPMGNKYGPKNIQRRSQGN